MLLVKCLLKQVTDNRGFVIGFGEELVQFRVLIAVDLQADFYDVFGLPGGFTLGIWY